MENNCTHSVPKLPRCSHVQVGKTWLFDQVMIFKVGWNNALISSCAQQGIAQPSHFSFWNGSPTYPMAKKKRPCLSSLWWGITHRACQEAVMIDAQQRGFLWLYELIALACDFVSVFGWRPGSEAFKLVNLYSLLS